MFAVLPLVARKPPQLFVPFTWYAPKQKDEAEFEWFFDGQYQHNRSSVLIRDNDRNWITRSYRNIPCATSIEAELRDLCDEILLVFYLHSEKLEVELDETTVISLSSNTFRPNLFYLLWLMIAGCSYYLSVLGLSFMSSMRATIALTLFLS